MKSTLVSLFAFASLCVFTNVQADSYPSRTVRIIATYPAGGLSDVMARIAAQILGDALGKSFIVENRPGGSGVAGTEYVARQSPDGYTLLMGSFGPITTAPALTPGLGYVPAKDLAPIVIMSQVPNILTVHPSVPAHSVAELVKLAKNSPQPMSAAISGIGGTTHLLTELFKQKTGTDFLNIPYKGTAPALTDLVGGQVQVDFENLPSILPFIKSGSVRALAAASKTRVPQLPDLPTFAELGYPGVEISAWHGLLAPAGTPKEVIVLINKAICDALQRPAMIERLRSMGVEPVGSTPDQMEVFLRTETIRWGQLIRDANIKAE